jgi:hypothetical protein
VKSNMLVGPDHLQVIRPNAERGVAEMVTMLAWPDVSEQERQRLHRRLAVPEERVAVAVG